MQLTYEMIENEDYGHIPCKGYDFIIVNRQPYYDSLYKGHNTKEFYKAIAVRLNDELDNDGFVPAYEITWNLLKDENSIAPCDWLNPENIEQKNFYRIEQFDRTEFI